MPVRSVKTARTSIFFAPHVLRCMKQLLPKIGLHPAFMVEVNPVGKFIPRLDQRIAL